MQEKVQLLFWKRGIFWATQAIARIIDGGPPPVKARSQCIHHFASDGPNTAQSQPCFSDLAPPCIEGNRSFARGHREVDNSEDRTGRVVRGKCTSTVVTSLDSAQL